ncbi:multidrug-efflux system transmembrane protein [Legionella feeleii]|uniref:Multidrug-efflux system transmembrane protein n=1 Tax=Legionella feeleii TaxID=453 RepID=A0A2X1QRI4_9GAMM|nr:multidrug-efflux system transmembrane protein [Legionella feeleii]
MSNFFIDRPIFAWVLAILIMLAGVLAIAELPIAQYPTVAPPAVAITAIYPGADAQTVQDTVTQIIEQNMSGLDKLLYMTSQSDSSGTATITLTFNSSANPDIAQVQVQNKLQLATPLLPIEVQQQGLTIEKSSSSFLLVLGAISEDGSMDQYDLADYLASYIKDPISRLNGVGDVQLFGAQYAMRIWLDPNKLNNYQLQPSDVVQAIKAQNNQLLPDN